MQWLEVRHLHVRNNDRKFLSLRPIAPLYKSSRNYDPIVQCLRGLLPVYYCVTGAILLGEGLNNFAALLLLGSDAGADDLSFPPVS